MQDLVDTCLRRYLPRPPCGLSGIAALLLMISTNLPAAERYVAVDGGDVSPYTTWATAATNIGDAMGVCDHGDVIIVSNGTYRLSANMGSFTKSVTITSLCGAAQTVIDGAGAYRSFAGNTLAITGTVYGLTITNAVGMYFDLNPTLQLFDCTIASCTSSMGGAIYMNRTITLIASNCLFLANKASKSGYAGGAIYFASSNKIRLYGCTFRENTAPDGYGGAVFGFHNSDIRIENCSLLNNSCSNYGGGVYLLSGITGYVANCTIISNNTTADGASGIYLGTGTIMENCLVTGNSAARRGAVETHGLVRNCTVVSNCSAWQVGGVYANGGTAVNSIVMFNIADGSTFSNYLASASPGTWINCCIAPDPAEWSLGTNCIVVDPQLEGLPADCRLSDTSPCRNAGVNQSWMTGNKDLDKHSRIAEAIVDIGAYEFYPAGTIFAVY